MSICYRCDACREPLRAPEEFAGRRIRCPRCGVELVLPEIPAETPAEVPKEQEVITADVVAEAPPIRTKPRTGWDIQFLDEWQGPTRVREYLDPPPPAAPRAAPVAAQPRPQPEAAPADPIPLQSERLAAADRLGESQRRLLSVLLDPRSIQWLLTLGGGLMILGGLIWLISWGVLGNALVLAVVFGALSLTVLGAGWWVTLRTRYRIAGRALAFLGCVVAPLNLWFYHAQELVTLDEGLWVGGVICVLLYAVTVRILRDPLFLYAVEAGVSLTVMLLLGSLGLASQATHVSILFMVLGMISIHATKGFPRDAETFSESAFGMPLFWCGQMQLASALGILVLTQWAGAVAELGQLVGLPEGGIPLTNSRWVPGLLWLTAAYAFLYSDLLVRRVGVYLYLSALSLVMALGSFVGLQFLGIEGLMALVAVLAMAIALTASRFAWPDRRLSRAVPPLALVMSVPPVLVGVLLHVRATSFLAEELGLQYETTWWFVGALLIVAVANRVTAFAYQRLSPGLSAAYLFFAAGSVILAAAGTLRMLGVAFWYEQATWLMLIPIAYMIAAGLWRGLPPQRPVAGVSHVATLVILFHALLAYAWKLGALTTQDHLYLAVILVQTAVVYSLAVAFFRRAVSMYLAVAAGCGAIWQLMLCAQWPEELFTLVFAAVGIVVLILAHGLGLQDEQVFDAAGRPRRVTRGRGVAALRAGHGVLATAILVSFMSGLSELARVGTSGHELGGLQCLALGIMTAVSIVAAIATPRAEWRRTYVVAAIAMGCLCFLTLNVAIDLSLWRKLQIFLVTAGVLLLGTGYVDRFQQSDTSRQPDMASFALWTGSLLAVLPLLIGVYYFWASSQKFARLDEFALLTVTLLMLASGLVCQIKAPTLLGGATLTVYLASLILSLLYRPQVAMGIYLAAGGCVLFVLGLILALCRDRLNTLPDKIANREGVFQIIGWK